MVHHNKTHSVNGSNVTLSRCEREGVEGKECNDSFSPVTLYHCTTAWNGTEQQQYVHRLFLLQKSFNYLKTKQRSTIKLSACGREREAVTDTLLSYFRFYSSKKKNHNKTTHMIWNKTEMCVSLYLLLLQ